MNFNFNDNLFGAFEDDIEKEITNLRKNKAGGPGPSPGTKAGPELTEK